MIKIIIIDDHNLVREGFRQILNNVKGMSVIGDAASAQAGLELVRQLNPHIVLLDLKLPDMDGMTAIKKLLRLDSEMQILVVSSITQDWDVFRVLEAGACGYVGKDVSPSELINAIRAIYAGRRYISPKLANRLALTTVDFNADNVFSKITPREMEILALVIRGLPVKDMAEQLGIKFKTVHSYRDRIFKKLGIKSDLALTLLAIGHGLLKLKDLEEIDNEDQKTDATSQCVVEVD